MTSVMPERTHRERMNRLRNGARRVCTHPRRGSRQLEAIGRQMGRSARTPQEQLLELDERPGNSTRERARLIAQTPPL